MWSNSGHVPSGADKLELLRRGVGGLGADAFRGLELSRVCKMIPSGWWMPAALSSVSSSASAPC